MKQLSYIIFISLAYLSGFLFSNNMVSISGKVTSEESLKGVEGVTIYSHGPHGIKYASTDKNGIYLLDQLPPGKYSIIFFPRTPFCGLREGTYANLKSGDNLIINKVIKLGGKISGNVYLKDKNTPIPDVEIIAFAWAGGKDIVKTDSRGSFILGENAGICPSENYVITAKWNIPGIAYKIIPRLLVLKGECSVTEDIVFDLNDKTGIQGYITSSLDSAPQGDATVIILNTNILEPVKGELIKYGEVSSDQNGFYSIKNLDPGEYELFFMPEIKSNYNYKEWSLLSKWIKGIKVEKGKIKNIDIQLDL